jgi:hypothetical protein
MKDEAGGVPLTEFIGLRSKMYSYVGDKDKTGQTAKGVKKYVIKSISPMTTIGEHWGRESR